MTDKERADQPDQSGAFEKKAEELEPEVIEGLKAFQRLLDVLKEAGTKISQPYAWPTEEELQREIEDLQGRIAYTLGVEFEIGPTPPEEEIELGDSTRPTLPYDEEERFTQEQAGSIWEAVLALPRQKTLSQKLRIRRGERKENFTVYLPKLPDNGDWRRLLAQESTSRTQLRISFNDDNQPTSFELDLVEQTRERKNLPSIIPQNHPLGNISAILAESYSGGRFWVRTVYETNWKRTEVVPPIGDRSKIVIKELSHTQAQSLLEMLAVSPKV